MLMSQRPLQRNSPISDDRFAVVGRVGSPYGVKGWVHCQSFTEPSENILNYPLFVQYERTWRSLTVAEIRPHKSNFLLKIAGCDDRDEAAVLRGCLLGTDVGEFAAPDENEFYWRDLIGLSVVNETGEELGQVKTLTETGHHDVLVVRSAQGRETLIPFADPFVVDVQLEGRKIFVAWASDW